MASPFLLLLSSFVIFFLVSSYAAPIGFNPVPVGFNPSSVGFKPTGIITPVYKNLTTLQYYAIVQMGNTLPEQKLLLDLGGELLWFDCDNYKSSSYNPIRCGSRKCKNAKGFSCVGCNGTPRPGCTNDTCGVDGFNPYADLLYSQGLGEDNTIVSSTNGVKVLFDHVVPHFAFACGTSSSLEGLASGITGFLGLAKTNVAFHKQIASAFKLAHKFSLCLSSTNGARGSMYIGGGPNYLSPYTKDLSKSLVTTLLITNPVSTAPIYSEGDASEEYFINVKSIKVGGKVVSLNTSLLAIDTNGVGGTKISTIASYTALHTSIYKALTKEFVKKAMSMKIKRVASAKPFGSCFSSKTITNSTTGPNVPTIDLVLQSKDVYWRIYGHNSMVEVKKGVVCLAFTDGGLKPRTSIVLGGYQLEDNLIQFDLDSSKFGFSNSLLLHNTSCSHYQEL